MQFDWRSTFGPALTALAALSALAVDRSLFAIPDPAPLFICIVALDGSLSGLRSSLASAALALASCAFLLSLRDAPQGHPLGYSAADLIRLGTFAAAAV